MNVVAIIPARGGSKDVPKKNIKLLAGKPLISYTIEAAVKSKQINRIVVSTDDEEIAEISVSYGVEVIRRPKELAEDGSPIIDAVIHVINLFEKIHILDLIILLQPTSPLRTSDDIDQAIELFFANKDKCDSVVSVSESDSSPFLSFKLKNGYLIPNFDKKYFKMRRQDLPKSFHPNGSIFISTKENLIKFRNFYGKKILPYIMSSEKSVDIDSDMDFVVTEIILRDYDE